MQGKLDTAMLPRDELRRLFMRRECDSDTHESLNCKRCPPKVKPASEEEAAAAAATASGTCRYRWRR